MKSYCRRYTKQLIYPIMICQNQLKCTKGPSGSDGRPCQRKQHDKCDPRPCTNIATNGPGNSRIYCPVCVTQLKLRSTHPCNSKHCIACGKQNKAKYGKRTDDIPIRATHCAECAKSVGYVLAGVTLCSFTFKNKTTCNSQAKVQSDIGAFCGTHAAGKECERKHTCKETGCTLAQIADGYCTTHCKERGISRRDNCVDCKEIRGTFKDGKELVCMTCKMKRMEIDPDRSIPSINAMCEVCGNVRRSYAPTKDGTPIRCEACCRDLGWHCVTNGICEIGNCDKTPRWGIRDPTTGKGKAVRCDDHCEKGDEDLKACQHCKYANTSTIKYFKPFCASCFYFLFPENPRVKNYKTKEQKFMFPLQKLYPELILDKPIHGGCSKKRPDGLIDCLTHSVIVEIDENQHNEYDETCENRRMMELFHDLGSRPIVFIRLNPDSYQRDGRTFSSIFSKTNNVIRFNQKEFNRRFEKLQTAVDNAITTIPIKTITIVRLYFTEI